MAGGKPGSIIHTHLDDLKKRTTFSPEKKWVMQDHWCLGFLPFHRVSQFWPKDIFCASCRVTPSLAALAPDSERAASQHEGRQVGATEAGDSTGNQQVG